MAARVKVGGVERAGRDGLRPPGAWPVAAVAGAIVAVLMVVSWRYGYHRDELYYLQQSAHLAWGSVDSGPLVIAIARAADACCHGALPALRFLLMNPVTAPVWLSGLVRLWRDPERGPYRAVAVAFVVLAPTIAVLIGDRPYFLAPMYTALLAAGAVAFERRLTAGRARWSRRAAVVVLVIGGVVAAPVALPLLPASVLRTVPLQSVNYDLGEQLGWPELSRTVVDASRSLGRSDAVVVGSNYGEAGAVLRYAPPGIAGRAFSGQNTDWWYGPPPDGARAAVLIGFGREHVKRFWTDCRQFGRIRNAAGVDNDEDGQPVWICTGQRSPWSRIWPEFRNYG